MLAEFAMNIFCRSGAAGPSASCRCACLKIVFRLFYKNTSFTFCVPKEQTLLSLKAAGPRSCNGAGFASLKNSLRTDM